MKKEKQKKPGSNKKYTVYAVVFFIVFFIVPFSVANFVKGGDEFLQSILPIVGALIFSLLINWFLWSKHITVVENEDADLYVKKDDIEITYRYDEYTHTT